ncbi:MAG: MucB/RseB C-terminal domain-containing protein [Methylotenera sp.]
MLRVVCALLLSAFSLSSLAVDDVWLLLQKTAYAARELNYQGVFVYQNIKQTSSVQITHMNNNGQEMTRNVVLDNGVQTGQSREVYSQGSNIVIFRPQSQKMVIEKRRGQNLFPAMLPTELQAIKASYTARLGALEYVAGREAQIIELIPNDAFRYSYKIWTDTEYGLLLKMALLNSKKQTLEQVAFSQIDMLYSQDVNWFQPKIDVSKNYVMEDATTVNHVESNWIVTELPAGYSKVDHIALVVPGKAAPVDQMIFSDGIASVSLFIEPLTKGMHPKMGHMLIGSTNICANVIDGYQITVVGEVPEATVMQIAKAVSFKKQTVSNK